MFRMRTFQRVAAALLPLTAVAVAVLAGMSGIAAQTPPAAIAITGADNGRTFNVVVGQQVTIRLGAGLNWTVSYDPTGILVAVPGVNTLARDVQGILRAAQPGTVTITATGKPICTTGQACPQFVTLFTATVVVAPAGAPSGGTAGQQPASPGRTQRPAAPATIAPSAVRPAPPAGVQLPNTGGAGPANGHDGRLVLGAALALGLAAALGAGALALGHRRRPR